MNAIDKQIAEGLEVHYRKEMLTQSAGQSHPAEYLELIRKHWQDSADVWAASDEPEIALIHGRIASVADYLKTLVQGN